MHRLFVAIRPPEHIRDLLIDAMDARADFRWQDEEQLHVTLRFVGEVDRPIGEDIRERVVGLVRAPPFSITRSTASAGSISAAPARFGQALNPKRSSSGRLQPRLSACAFWASVSNPSVGPFIRISRLLAGKAAARAKSQDSPRPAPEGLASKPFEVGEFILFESHLSRHGAHVANR